VYRFALVQRQQQNELLINTFAFRVASVTNPEDEDSILESMFNSVDGGFTTAIGIVLGAFTAKAALSAISFLGKRSA